MVIQYIHMTKNMSCKSIDDKFSISMNFFIFHAAAIFLFVIVFLFSFFLFLYFILHFSFAFYRDRLIYNLYVLLWHVVLFIFAYRLSWTQCWAPNKITKTTKNIKIHITQTLETARVKTTTTTKYRERKKNIPNKAT